MGAIEKTCCVCTELFTLTEEDIRFYESVAPVFRGEKTPPPLPHSCPLCRDQKRLTLRNERNLYKRTSPFSGKPFISSISEDKPYTVLPQDEWWSDAWDGIMYGRDYDFGRPFFEQFDELRRAVPRMNLNIYKSENCEYCNFIDFSHNCYLVFGASNSEDVSYASRADSSKDSMDVTCAKDSEHCYDSVDIIDCYQVFGSIKCEKSRDLAFCFDCKNCSDCILCFNLRNKQYCIHNTQYTKEEYMKKKGEFSLSSYRKYQQLKKNLQEIVEKNAIHRAAKLIQCESSIGDNLTNSKNAKWCFDSNHIEDSKYVHFSMNCRNVYDIMGSATTGCEYCLDGLCIEGNSISFGYYIAGNNDIHYCDSVYSCSNIFGCVGLKQKQYCILNKQYTKEEYENLVPKIIDHMIETKEYGEYFPVSISPFCYNETAAHDVYPLTKEEALSRGYTWKEDEKKETQEQTYAIPDSIEDVPETITSEILSCVKCSKNYKIIQNEFSFYKRNGIPIPHLCPNCRHYERMKWRNPCRIWTRTCEKCNEETSTTYPPERKAKILCEKCYFKTV